ncbi:hypothetical protein HOD83_00770 [Candidatus Woesearchaeota archaeon]|jgi:hypothetical protein|nr:hypothetical protein [Candidatus Woesearchaeota archaeon]MBT4114037.1 hypothetical protein [Candidatus Woesearchaeota archaeon]MBT4248106.1 hypothetical protein [Candidatus Woesearchaeota archaeon]
MLNPEEIIIYAVIFGLLLGITWSLKYIVLIDRKIERVEMKIERLLRSKK